jgi:hypothetical protein
MALISARDALLDASRRCAGKSAGRVVVVAIAEGFTGWLSFAQY